MKEYTKEIPRVCVGFDGVIHSYTSPWQGYRKAVDPPVDGAIKWLEKMVFHFEVCIMSTRNTKWGEEEL